MHLDMLTYGDISSREAADIAGHVHQLLPAQGLVKSDSWPALGRVYSLSSVQGQGGAEEGSQEMGAEAAAAASNGSSDASAAAAAAGSGPVWVTYLPDNPNPSNSNHAVYYWVQVSWATITINVFGQLGPCGSASMRLQVRLFFIDSG